jgi:hypothetical protein
VRAFAPGAAVGALLVLVPLAIVVAGAPARESAQAAVVAPAPPEIEIDPAQLPDATISAEAAALQGEVDPNAVALGLAKALAVEAEAIRRADTSLLRSADDGERLIEMERLVEKTATSGVHAVPTHTFDSMHVDVAPTEETQDAASLGLVATGTVETVTYDAAGEEQGSASEPFSKRFVLRPEVGDRWLIVAEAEDG